jgi:type I restriction enzyme S subunit
MKVADVGADSQPHEFKSINSAFGLLASASNGVSSLRQLILSLAVQGKLAPQDPSAESASALLARITEEQDRLGITSPKKESDAECARESGVQPFPIPAAWRWARMTDVCAYIQRGKGPEYAERSRCAVISQKCVRWYGLDYSQAKYISESSLERYEDIRFLRSGDILWNSTGTGTIGRAIVVPTDSPYEQQVADSHVTVLRPLIVNPLFLWRWIQSPIVQSEIEGSASGSTNQIELATSTVRKHLVPIPPLEEQHRIVARVEELMKLCDALEENGRLEAEQHARLVSTLFDTLAASESPQALTQNWQRIAQHFDLLLDRPEAVDALEQLILQLAVRGLLATQESGDESAIVLLNHIQAHKDRLVKKGKLKSDKPQAVIDEHPFELPPTWIWVRLGQLGEAFDYGTSQKSIDDPAAVPVLRMGNIQAGKVLMSGLKYLKDQEQELPNLLLRPGDLLFNRTNSYELVGKTAMFEGFERDVTFASYLIRVRLAEGLCVPQYVNLYMNSLDCRRTEIEPELTQQNGQANYNGTKLRGIRVPLPPLAEQHRIVARVKELRELCAQLRERLTSKSNTQARLAEAIVQSAVSA